MQARNARIGNAARHGPSWRAGLMLGALVVLAHLALLRDAALFSLTAPGEPRFNTRVIEAVGPAPAVAVPQPAPTRPRPTTVPTKSAPSPAPEPSPASPMAEVAPQETAPAVAANALPAPTPQTPVPETLPSQPIPNPDTAKASPTPEPDPAAPARPPRESALAAGVVIVPPPVRLRYQVRANKFPFSANADLLWRPDGAQYEARLSIGAFGLSKVQTSRGEIGPKGLLPSRYSDKYRSEVAAHFERDKGRISFSANTPDAPLLEGAQDYLSVMLQLAAMLAGEPERYPLATTLTIQIAGPRDAEVWLFTVEGPETLALPGGEQKTTKLLRHPRRPFDQQVELWFAPALAYLPVRLRISEANGDYLDQKWTGNEPLP